MCFPFLRIPMPPLLIAGSVASEEEAFRVQQIALVTQWMLLLSAATSGAAQQA
jgi:hypothetical protein